MIIVASCHRDASIKAFIPEIITKTEKFAEINKRMLRKRANFYSGSAFEYAQRVIWRYNRIKGLLKIPKIDEINYSKCRVCGIGALILLNSEMSDVEEKHNCLNCGSITSWAVY